MTTDQELNIRWEWEPAGPVNAVDPDNIHAALAWVLSQRSLIEEPGVAEGTVAADAGVVAELRALARRNVTQAVQPWDVGYEQARVDQIDSLTRGM